MGLLITHIVTVNFSALALSFFLVDGSNFGNPHLRQVLRVSGSRAVVAARTEVARSAHGVDEKEVSPGFRRN